MACVNLVAGTFGD